MKYYLSCVIILIFGCQSGTADSASFDKKEMLVSLADSIMSPRMNHFNHTLRELEKAVQEAESAKTHAAFSGIQTKWKHALFSWKMLESIYVGYLTESYTKTAFYSLPTIEKINRAIQGNDDLSSDRVRAKIADTEKNLLALDYLLFAENSAQKFLDNPRYRNYILFIAEELQVSYTKLHSKWLLQKDAVLKSNESGRYEDIQVAITEYVNAFVYLVEDYRDYSIGNLLGIKNGGTLSPEKAEASYSNLSKDALLEGVIGLESVFYGNNGKGFDDLLQAIGSEYGDQLKRELDSLKRYISELPDADKISENKEPFETVYNHLTIVLKRLKVDIAALLNVTIGFSDNDGD